MNASQRRDNAMPTSALLRFRMVEKEYGTPPTGDKPKLCLTNLSLFTCDTSYLWEGEAKDGRYSMLVVRFNDDGSMTATTQHPAGWFDQSGIDMMLMPSLRMACELLNAVHDGGELISIEAELDETATPTEGSGHGQ